ncbi:MAG: ABC transporter substrate-binding protein [Rhodocyclaceae bacterium]
MKQQLAAVAFVLAAMTQAVAPACAAAGVSRDEIVIGSIQDLSGPISALGVHFRNGLEMRFDEENARGGIHGRRIRLVVEDSGYDPRRAVLAAQKLIQRDGVFALINDLGSPVVMATMPMALEHGVLHLFPGAPLAATYEPVHPLKFQIFAPYSATTPIALRHLLRSGGYRRPAILYQDDDFGHEVLRGFEATLREIGLPVCEKTSYKRGATDFASQIARLRSAGCDFVTLATVVRETVGAVSAARRAGWQVPMLVTTAAYSAQIHELGGAAMEGLYGVAQVPHPYRDEANPELTAWIERYARRFGVEPNTWSVQAWLSAELFIRAARDAGPALDAARLSAALERLSTPPDFFGSPGFVFTPADHLGMRAARIVQIRNGRWRYLGDYLRPETRP